MKFSLLLRKDVMLSWLMCWSIASFGQGYLSDSVIIKTGTDTFQIGATVTRPARGKSLPAVVIVSGTGKQDREGNMGGTKWFALIADHLTRNGFIVLRMDDRGVGQTSGDYARATTYDFAQDALKAVSFLKNYPGVDRNKIGLLGHSEGGAAISIAASESKDVKFLISLSGLAMNGLDALITQNEALVNHSPLKERDRIRANEINGLMFKTAYQYADSSNMEQVLNATYTNWKLRDDAFFEKQEDQFDHFRFPVWSFVQQATGPWYRFFVRYNAELYLSYVKVPVLAINGDKDDMVVPDNLKMWKKYADRGKNPDVETYLLPGLNHLLQPVELNKERLAKKEQIVGLSPEVLATITSWLQKRYQ